MNAETKKLLDAALRLAPAERESLAGELFDSLESNNSDAEAVWASEIERRIAELDRGDVKPIPWAEARRLIFEEPDDSA